MKPLTVLRMGKAIFASISKEVEPSRMHSAKAENTTELQIGMQCLLATQITIKYL